MSDSAEWLRNQVPKATLLTRHQKRFLLVADELSRLSSEVSNLKLANKEARKTIDRLNAMIPQEANSGFDLADPILDDSSD